MRVARCDDVGPGQPRCTDCLSVHQSYRTPTRQTHRVGGAAQEEFFSHQLARGTGTHRVGSARVAGCSRGRDTATCRWRCTARLSRSQGESWRLARRGRRVPTESRLPSHAQAQAHVSRRTPPRHRHAQRHMPPRPRPPLPLASCPPPLGRCVGRSRPGHASAPQMGRWPGSDGHRGHGGASLYVRRAHFFLGGVSGRAPLPKPNLAFSAGLRMRKEHMRLSSMAITAPALSNSPQ